MKNMIELMKFIFSDFWIWLGFVILTAGVLNGIAEIIEAIKK